MRRMHKRTLLLLITLVALVLAGCGSSSKPLSKQEYRQKLDGYAQTFKDNVLKSREKLRSAADPNARAAGVGEFKDEFSTLAKQLDDIEPPKPAKSAHDALVTTLKKGADDLGSLQSAVKAKDQTKTQDGARTLQEDNVKVQSELQDLRSALAG